MTEMQAPNPPAPPQITVFDGVTKLMRGPLPEIAQALHARGARPDGAGLLLIEDATGRPINVDLSGDAKAVADRYAPAPRPRGRPKLGVVAREVTLLPRHWDWLASQRGGASATLRRLIDAARKADGGSDHQARRDAAYGFLSAIASHLPGFEEASRALFADDRAALAARMADWPENISTHTLDLLDGTLPTMP